MNFIKHFNLRLFFGVATLLVTASACAQDPSTKYPFPDLPYAYNALEPYIDAQTMELHYSKHHKGYYNKFLKAVEEEEMTDLSIEEIFAKASTLNTFLRNNAGGYYNHMLFWENMTPDQKPMPAELQKAIDASFGSVDAFKEQFSKQAATVFGSGWAWLVKTPDGKLAISSTPNQDNPLMDDVAVKGTPLLALDVWEHAYYLHYQNKRGSYIEAFWNVVNWETVANRMTAK